MSKFQSTISTVAALASIFGAGAAGWKLAQTQVEPTPQTPALEQKLTQLEQKIETKLITPQPEIVPHAETPPQAPVTPLSSSEPPVLPPPPEPPPTP